MGKDRQGRRAAQGCRAEEVSRPALPDRRKRSASALRFLCGARDAISRPPDSVRPPTSSCSRSPPPRSV
ncbi:hypothetical protein [Lysobacter gummosus]|uniref:hypothetical protein n=1 Tax=Lysobacter gummosus TaxID=262324 RepID=UPI00363C6C4F